MSLAAPPPPTDPMLPRPVRLREVRRDTADTSTLVLDPPDDEGFAFRPGQFTMLYQFGVGEVPISISGDPTRRDEIIHTIRAAGSVTDALCALAPGSSLGLRGPFGNPWPIDRLDPETHVVLVAGGIGLAPLRPLVYHVLAHTDACASLTLLYGARTPADLLYTDEFDAWRDAGIDVRVTVDRVAQGEDWAGHIGVVTTLFPGVSIDPAHTIAMLCGPEIMMRFVVRSLFTAGLPLDAIHLSMERNMKCAVGFCGHCQYGPHFVCKDGPVFRYDQIAWLFAPREY